MFLACQYQIVRRVRLPILARQLHEMSGDFGKRKAIPFFGNAASIARHGSMAPLILLGKSLTPAKAARSPNVLEVFLSRRRGPGRERWRQGDALQLRWRDGHERSGRTPANLSNPLFSQKKDVN
jgi:hypothetical protein